MSHSTNCKFVASNSAVGLPSPSSPSKLTKADQNKIPGPPPPPPPPYPVSSTTAPVAASAGAQVVKEEGSADRLARRSFMLSQLTKPSQYSGGSSVPSDVTAVNKAHAPDAESDVEEEEAEEEEEDELIDDDDEEEGEDDDDDKQLTLAQGTVRDWVLHLISQGTID